MLSNVLIMSVVNSKNDLDLISFSAVSIIHLWLILCPLITLLYSVGFIGSDIWAPQYFVVLCTNGDYNFKDVIQLVLRKVHLKISVPEDSIYDYQ